MVKERIVYHNPSKLKFYNYAFFVSHLFIASRLYVKSLAGVAELVDALDSGSSVRKRCASSNLALGTMSN